MAMLLAAKRAAYASNSEATQRAQPHLSIEDLPEALVGEILKRITRTSDLNSFSLVSKQLYAIDADQRSAIRVSGLSPATEALASLCTRFPNLRKVEIEYTDWAPDNGNQLNNEGFREFSTRSPSLTDLTLTCCSGINDEGLASLSKCKNLTALRLNSAKNVTSAGLLSVAVGCRSLSALHLFDCNQIDSMDWLNYFGRYRSLEELVVKHCWGITQYDLLEFSPGWRKLRKFEFLSVRPIESMVLARALSYYDSSYDAHKQPTRFEFDLGCESMKELSLARFEAGPELGLRNLLGKCKALEKLHIEYVHGLNDRDMAAISQSCSNLRSVSLWLMPRLYDEYEYRTPFTDDTLKALALGCPMLENIELRFKHCVPTSPSEIRFSWDGLLALVEACPIRALVLNSASFFDDEGMEAIITFAPFLETLELVDCKEVTDAGMRLLVHAPSLRKLTLRWSHRVTDDGFTDLVRAKKKLQSLTIECCCKVSEQAVQGAAGSVHYTPMRLPSVDSESESETETEIQTETEDEWADDREN